MAKRKPKSRRYPSAKTPSAPRGSEAELAVHQSHGALGRAAAARLLLEWGHGPPPTPPKTMEKSINHIRDAILKALACAEGKKALDGIADVLDKYGKSLPPELKAELVSAGEQLWTNLVRLGCPV